jgi:hypothetical protein
MYSRVLIGDQKKMITQETLLLLEILW